MSFTPQRSASNFDSRLMGSPGHDSDSSAPRSAAALPAAAPAGGAATVRTARADRLSSAPHAAPDSAPWILDETFPSCTQTAKQLLDVILGQLQSMAWEGSNLFAVHLSLEEAVMNAIKHGNRYDRNKQVRLRCVLHPGCVQFEIEDEGAGFDPEQVPDCTQNDNLEACSGRGIALIRNFMSHVEYQNRGRRLVMAKRISA